MSGTTAQTVRPTAQAKADILDFIAYVRAADGTGRADAQRDVTRNAVLGFGDLPG